MIRISLLACFVLFTANLATAQDDPPNCVPDTTLENILFIDPQPYVVTDTSETGGIPDQVLYKKDLSDEQQDLFEFTFTTFVPDTANFPGFGTVTFSSLSFATEGAINYEDEAGMPSLEQFTYSCNPPDCKYLPNEWGCVKISGKPVAGDVGTHSLKFKGTVDFGFPIEIEFPNPALFPGTYELVVLETSSNTRILSGFELTNTPNPFRSTTDILIRSEQSGPYEFQVHDMFGRLIERRPVEIFEGDNTISFDGSNLASGLYLYSLTDGQAVISRKMMVNND
jgi:hypothetical protein